MYLHYFLNNVIYYVAVQVRKLVHVYMYSVEKNSVRLDQRSTYLEVSFL